MARAVLALAMFATLAVGSMAAPYLQVSLTFDNQASHALNNNKAVNEELASELCFTDKAKVATVRIFDENSAINTQARGVYGCFPGKYPLDKMLEWCNKGRYKSEFMDELEDRTMPDLEVEKFACTICDTTSLTTNGPCFAKSGPTLRVEKPASGVFGG